ncbi:hypothetical protein [Nocardiopsis coralliicola]
MSTTARHVAGFVTGLAAVPAVTLGIAWAPGWVEAAGADRLLAGAPGWTGPLAAAALVGILLGILMGSRISPLAALVPGLAVGAVGVLDMIGAHGAVPAAAALAEPPGGAAPWFAWGPALTAVGAALTMSALFPSRWRSLDLPLEGYAGLVDQRDDWEDGVQNVRVAQQRSAADDQLWDSTAPPPPLRGDAR